MRTYKLLGILLLLSYFSNGASLPLWTRDVNAFPDSASVYPVRIKHDTHNNVYVLSNYSKNLSGGGFLGKIYVTKYFEDGTMLWQLVYDSAGTDSPRAYDLALDTAGNCYVAGGKMISPFYKPLLLKINSAGILQWVRDSATTFSNGFLSQLISDHNRLYARGTSGICVFDETGTELWSNGTSAEAMAVDGAGQTIVSTYAAGFNSLFRFDPSGNLNLTDSTFTAKRIATDSDNNIYLLSDNSNYEMSKFDSTGAFQWSAASLPIPPPSFGDIGMEILIDQVNDVILVGLADSIVKYSPSGTLLYKKSMHGLDNYIIDAEISFSNTLFITGSTYDTGQYNIRVAAFDLNGNENWRGHYSANSGLQEFAAGLTIDNSGIYVVENDQQYTKVLKFDSPFFSSTLDYSLVCVDSVWYDSIPGLIHVRVFNGNLSHLNYPSVQIVAPNLDTISNPGNIVSFFAHLGNYYLEYIDTITVQGITSFANYTFLISEGLTDTTAVIHFCEPVGIEEHGVIAFNIYPNPATNSVNISNLDKNKETRITVLDSRGAEVLSKKFKSETAQLNTEALSPGIYFLRIENGSVHQAKLLKLQR